MAIYEYKCAVCRHTDELEVPIKDSKSILECPLCRVFAFKRQISKSTFSLKGGGWYADGYSTKTSKNSES